ncbi:MAG: hypothetical protein ACKOWR_05075 [Micrococcales bacterium]
MVTPADEVVLVDFVADADGDGELDADVAGCGAVLVLSLPALEPAATSVVATGFGVADALASVIGLALSVGPEKTLVDAVAVVPSW